MFLGYVSNLRRNPVKVYHNINYDLKKHFW